METASRQVLGALLVGEGTIVRILSRQLGLPLESGPLRPEPSAVRLVRGPFARQRRVVPLRLDGRALHVVTLEDLIEYRLKGVSQVQVNPRSGPIFPSAPGSVLRQDPDVIMVGEIRDRETAEIAMSAAITGHFVLFTLNGGLPESSHSDLYGAVVPGAGEPQRAVPPATAVIEGGQGLFQILTVTDAIREGITQGASAMEIQKRA